MKRLWVPAILILACVRIQAATTPAPLAGHVIAIDPGHGTVDFHGNIINSGKITRNGKYVEYQLNFQICQKLGKAIEQAGGHVIYTRTPHDYWRQASSVTEDNKARALLANELKAEAFIAIHCDWDPRARFRGITTYYKSPESRKLGEAVHKKLIRRLEVSDRHVKRDSYTVLDYAAMPSILVETGFLSNRNESKKLATPKYQTRIADAIVSGLNSYFSN